MIGTPFHIHRDIFCYEMKPLYVPLARTALLFSPFLLPSGLSRYKMVSHLASRLLMIFSIIVTLFFLDLRAQMDLNLK